MWKRMSVLAIAAAFGLAMTASDAQAQGTFGFGATGGVEIPSGDLGDAFDLGFGGEANLFYQLESGLRFGAGANVVSYDSADDAVDESTTKIGVFGLVQYMFQTQSEKFHPYIQGRAGFASFDFDPDSESGFEGGGGVGVEIGLTEKVMLNVQGMFTFITLSDIGDVSGNDLDGTNIGLRAGLNVLVN